MDAGHLPGYFSISLVMEEKRLPNNFPDGHNYGYRHEHHPPTNSMQNNVNAVSNDVGALSWIEVLTCAKPITTTSKPIANKPATLRSYIIIVIIALI